MGFIISRKWSPALRRPLRMWEVRTTKGRLLHTTRSYSSAVLWLRRRSKIR